MSDFDDVRCLDAPLADKLEAYSARLVMANPTISSAYTNLVQKLMNAGAGGAARGVGDEMPSFALPDSTGSIRRLESFLETGPLVISFNRGHWCSYCRLELLALNEIVSQIGELGASLVSIMPETATLTRQLRERFSLGFPILTDIDNGFALRSNLMVALGPAVADLLRKSGNDLARFQGNDAWFVPIPATYVVGRNGIIAAAFVNPDFRRRMSPQAILKALETQA
ncbi:MAG: AhpC/TSA family protein [Nitratireductor sp.]|nr:AhpC/TSA family protein [Nitratireductor sp.]